MQLSSLFFLAACGNAFRSRTRAKTQRCGSCADLESKMRSEAWNPKSLIGGSDLAIGNEDGTCCQTKNKFSHVLLYDLYSASKMVTSYTILKLVDQGLLSFDTKAADVFDWWTATDSRKDVNLRHLLSQTSGVGQYPLGLALCTDGVGSGNGTRVCARQAYEDCFNAAPGETFQYTESTFFIISAMALEVTGLDNWDDVFQQYLGEPLGINPRRCRFSAPSYNMAFAGGGLRCRTDEYAKILQAILAKTLYSDLTLYDEAERPHTLHLPPICTPAGCLEGSGSGTNATAQEHPPGGVIWHYGLGQWVECATQNCEGGILRTSSAGAMGTYPWIDRGGLSGNKPNWGIMVRMWLVNIEGIDKFQKEVIPMVGAIVQ